MSAFGYRKPADLPRTLPLFPLAGAILFPRGVLPLNIFEPRYLNMIDDALASGRLIGIIQPAPGKDGALAPVGTAGRITTFSEAEDGRYLITLTGVCRFRFEREFESGAPYRKANVGYDEFAADLSDQDGKINRAKLRTALRRYIDRHGYHTDWSAVDDAPPEALVNAVAVLCPFDPPAKQALLESRTLTERCEALIALLQWGADRTEGPLQ